MLKLRETAVKEIYRGGVREWKGKFMEEILIVILLLVLLSSESKPGKKHGGRARHCGSASKPKGR